MANLIVKFFRVIFFLDKTQSQSGKGEEQRVDLTCNSGNFAPDDTKIHVEDEVPNFLKEQDTPCGDERNPLQIVEAESDTNDILEFVKNETEVDSSKSVAAADAKAVNEVVKEDPERVTSLLDNKPLVKMFEECADVIKQIERIKKGFQSEDFCDVLDSVREQLIQAMNLSGGNLINDEEAFNLLRHQCRRGVNAEEGDEIANTIASGIALEDRVFVKAIVELKKEKVND